MKTPQYEQRNEDPMAMIWILVAVNVIMFLLPENISSRFVLSGDFIKDHAWYQLITAGFMHGGFGHLFFNMWGLYIFGTLVTPHIGNKRFLLLYLLGVLTGNLLFLAFNWGLPFYLLGASGAVCAVMAAAAVLEPNRQFVIIFFPFFPLKTSTLVVAYTVIELISQLAGSSSGVANLAHLGGFLAGYVYLKILYGNQLPWDPMRRKKTAASFRGPADWTARDYRSSTPPPPGGGTDNTPVTTRELDYLLDKISRQGINSLSEEELVRLRLARKQMRGE